METIGCKTPQMFCVTPTANGHHFNFPPDAAKLVASVDRLKTTSNYPVQIRSRRSFTPMKNSFLLDSPKLSPIAFNNGRYSGKMVVRCPPEKVSKAAADSTVSETPMKSRNDGFLTPLPPPQCTRFSCLNVNKRNNRDGSKSTTPIIKKHVPFYYDSDDFQQARNNTSDCSFVEDDANKSQCALDKSARHGYLNHKLSVETILESNHLKKLVPVFEQGDVEFELFLTLNEDDLRRLGIKRLKDRASLMRIINELN